MTGTYAIIRNVIPSLVRSGWEIHVFAAIMDKKSIRDLGAVPHKIWTLRWGKTLRWLLFDRIAALCLRLHAFDLVWGHGDIFNQDVLSLHNCVHKTNENIYQAPPQDKGVAYFHRRLLSEGKFSKLIANSHLMKSDIMDRYGIKGDLIDVVYPGYDPEIFGEEDKKDKRSGARRELGIPDDAFLIGLMTSGDFKKRGVERFFEVLEKLPSEIKKNVYAIVIGKEKNLKPYRQIAGRLGFDKNSVFKPPMVHVEEYLLAMDAMVYPAYFEEFGIAVIEAVMSGVPVVTTRSVGAAELIGGEARNFVYEKYDSAKMAQGLAQLFTDQAIRQRVIADGRKSAGPYTWKNYSAKMIDCLEQVWKQLKKN